MVVFPLTESCSRNFLSAQLRVLRASAFISIWFNCMKPVEPYPSRGLELFAGNNYFSSMPIYEFHCEKCEKDSEILVRSRDWTGTKCPHCGSTKIAKKFSTFASSSAGEAAPAKSSGGGRCCGGSCHGH